MRLRSRLFTGSAVLSAALLAVALTAPASAAPANASTASADHNEVGLDAEDCALPGTQTFNYLRAQVQHCTVPNGVSSLTVTVIGGEGAGAEPDTSPGGKGGKVIADLPVTPGDVLSIWVAQHGQDDGGWGWAYGGPRGTVSVGGPNGAGGGGASAVSVGSSAIPQIIAGGGGGGAGGGATSTDYPGGTGGYGGLHPQDGGDGTGDNNNPGGVGGKGGGASGTSGGAGESFPTTSSGGGGGGGGYPNGGAGGQLPPSVGTGSGGGGGGDSFVQSPATAYIYPAALYGGNGSVTLSTDSAAAFTCSGSGTIVNLSPNLRYVHAIAIGGQGGYPNGDISGKPGFGAQIDADINLDPDLPSQLKLAVGCAGTGGGGWGYGTGGWQGTAPPGGYSGSGGGGATAIEDTGGPIVVAGGGGGAGGAGNGSSDYGGDGGNAGYGFGRSGANPGGDGRGGGAGQGGAAAGNGSIDGQNGEDAGEGSAAGAGGGGGGGLILPHYGGGIGGGDGDDQSGGGGGGAGASYARLGDASDVHSNVSPNVGNGVVFISWQQPFAAHITPISGSDQSATIGTAFAQPLAVQVTDQNNVPLDGVNVTFAAPSTGASGTFPDGTTKASVQTIGHGMATSPPLTANRSGGPFVVTATAGEFAGSAGFSLANVIASTTTSSPQLDTVVFGQPNADTVTVTGDVDGPAPTGAVDFFLCGPLITADGCATGGTDAGNANLSNASATSPARAAGSPGIWCYRSAYTGDDNYSASADASADECFTVKQAATKTTLSEKPASPVSGESVTLTSHVTVRAPGAGLPSGTIAFTDGSTALGTAALDATGTATLTTSGLAVGSHELRASYSGDANLEASASAKHDYPVARATSATTLSATPDAAVFGQSVTLNASVAAVAPGAGVPTGSVRFTSGTNVLGTATVIDGSATLVTSALPVGADTVTVSYGGDDAFTSSVGQTSVTVSPAATTTVVTADPISGVFGQAVTLSARVSVVAPGAGALAGTVEFTNGSTVLGTADVDAGGAATLITTALPVGAAAISARYRGTVDLVASSATAPATVTVAPAETTTDVTVDPETAVAGQNVTIRARVRPVSPASGVPSGTVEFSVGSTSLGSAELSDSGIATLRTDALPVGASTITASYAGNDTFNASTGNIDPTVAKASTATVLAAHPDHAVVGTPVTLSADVTVRHPGSGTPTGTVTFSTGSTALGAAHVDATGHASITSTDLPVGAPSVTATYSGDDQLNGSHDSVTVTVTPAATGPGGHGGGLAATGSSITQSIPLAALLLAVGVLLLYWMRRRGSAR